MRIKVIYPEDEANWHFTIFSAHHGIPFRYTIAREDEVRQAASKMSAETALGAVFSRIT